MKKLLPVVVGLAILGLVLTPLVLHYGQKRHDQISPAELAIPGVEGGTPPPLGTIYALTAAAVIEHELHGFTGWRPNDLFFWGPGLWADNNANRQLGILLGMRESVRVFKDHLTKVSSDVYDQNLVQADNLLRNDPHKWAFPSAESRYAEAAAKLRAYAAGLSAKPPTSRPINARNVELIRLMQGWSDLLGDAHAELYKKDVPWLEIDDVYYRAQGACHAIGHMLAAVQLEYRQLLTNRAVLETLFDEAKAALFHCATVKPIAIANGGEASLLANHRRNLDVDISEARQKLYSIREELEK
jgi:hypothetical protein